MLSKMLSIKNLLFFIEVKDRYFHEMEVAVILVESYLCFGIIFLAGSYFYYKSQSCIYRHLRLCLGYS